MPTNLRHGINIPYLTGTTWYWYSLGYSTFDVYRLNTLMNATDYNQIRYQDGNPLIPQFDHVRLPIDPMFLQCQTSGPDKGAIGANTGPFMGLLSQMVTTILNSGMAVILDFHPYIVSENHYDAVKPATATQSDWTSTYKRDYVCAENGQPGDHFPIVSPSHPLVKFWNSFSIALAGEIAAGHLPANASSKVYLEIMNEPMVDFNFDRFSDIYTGPGAQSDYAIALTTWEGNWRGLQQKTIETIHQSLPNFKCIATSYTSLPQDFVGWAENSADTLGSRTHYTKPYRYDELLSMGTVYYAVHFYDPFRFTEYNNHFNWIDNLGVWRWNATSPFQNNDPKYDPTRDYDGLVNGSLDLGQFKTQNPPEPNGSNWWLLDRNMSAMILAVDNWKASQDPPPQGVISVPVGIIFTEFGANKRPTDGQDEGPGGPGADPFEQQFGDPWRIDRAQWYYDARTSFEARGYGWDCFEYIGNKGAWTGLRMHQSDPNGPIHGHTDHGAIHSTLRQALFGSTRP